MNEMTACEEGGGGLCRPTSRSPNGVRGVETGAGPAVIPTDAQVRTRQWGDGNLSEACGTHGHGIK